MSNIDGYKHRLTILILLNISLTTINNNKELQKDFEAFMLLNNIGKKSSYLIKYKFYGCSIFFHRFAYVKQLLNITNKLSSIDTIKFDKLCQKFFQNYNNQDPSSKNGNVPEEINIEDEASVMEGIRCLYEDSSKRNVGFLRGDIHGQFVFKLNRYLAEKGQFQLKDQLTKQEYKNILNMITDSKSFRLPKKGIKNSAKENQKNLFQRQLLLQIVSNSTAMEKYQNVLESLTRLGKVHLSSAFKKYYIDWFHPLCAAIKEEQNMCRVNQNLTPSRKLYAPYISNLSAEKLATVSISQLLKHITNIIYRDQNRNELEANDSLDERESENQIEKYDSINYKNLCLSIAKWVAIQQKYEVDELNFKMIMRNYDNLYKQMSNKIQQLKKQRRPKNEEQNVDGGKNVKVNFQEQQKKIKSEYQKMMIELREKYKQKFVPVDQRKNYLKEIQNKIVSQYHKIKTNMSEEVQFEIGSLIIYLLKQILKIENKSGFKIPLLTLQHKYSKFKTMKSQFYYQKRLKVNDHFLKTVIPIIEKEGDVFMHLDRCVPTIINPMPWVSYEIGGYYLYPTSFMKIHESNIQERLVKYADLHRVYNVLNSLSNIPWKINTKVLDIIEKIWQEGGNVGDIPERYPQMINTYLINLKTQTNYLTKKKIEKKIQRLRDQYSLRCDFNLKLNIARSYVKLERFFYPHNVDFRGRVYPIPPHLSHIGNDLSRGLLIFADGKKIGPEGLRWLKIHVANLMGKDKQPIPQKLIFIQSHVHLIKQIAEQPLKNRQWLKHQDCWQLISAIIQLNQALKLDNPQQYISCLHIHQDGSCNGLQHYAALGRDTQGAYQVNLGPNERPGDVYTYVANMVIKMIDKDILDLNSPNHELAKKISGNIKRKTIKQTVMTSVYGVTFIGAREQIYRQIQDQEFLDDEDQQYAASIYIAKLTLKEISNLFSSAHHIKSWLIECAKIVTFQGNPMGWITPMGLPVVQPYRKQNKDDYINTIIQQLVLARRPDNLPINKARQKSAFPPNFIHSLDSTHMMLTAQRCIKQGIVFAAVHDSYWTHASTVNRMNEILRQQFINLHSQPLLQNLKASLQHRYPKIKFPDVPKRGSFDLNKIKESIYFFS